MADINLTAEQVAALILSIGDKSKLKTADKQTIVGAINEVIDSNLAPQIGDLDDLATSAKDNLVAAINEVLGKADNAATAAATAKQTADNAATAAGNAATAAATAQQTADNAATAAGNAATAAQNAQQTAAQSATDAKNAVHGMDISRNTNGGYTAKWTENSMAKSASIYGGVGLAEVTEIMSFNTDTQLPMLYKSKIDGSHEYPVMIGDLLVYTGADYIVSVWSAEAGTTVEQTIAARNEVFRVRAVSNYGTDDEYYNVERTGLVLQENGFVDRREEWLAWLLESEGQTSDADVSLSQVFRFLKQLPDGLHYLDNTACWGKFWSVNQGGKCVVFAPPDIYIITGDSGVLKMTSAGTLEKYSNSGEMLVKSVDLLNSVPPKTTSADAGKVLTVAADGSLVWQ